MGTNPKCVDFTFDWTHRWADFDHIVKGMTRPRYYFVTSFNNVSFRWYSTMYAAKDGPKIEFDTFYDDGPLEKINVVSFKVGVAKSDQSLHTIRTAGAKDYLRGATNKGAWGWPKFEDNDATAVRSKYGLTESDRLTYQITIKIPVEMFAFCIPSSTPTPSAPWLVKLFNSINNAEESSLYSDTKVASRDGTIFNCHKGIVAAQSDALKTIFRYPPSDEGSGEPTPEDEEQSVASPKKRKLSAMKANSVGTQCGGTGVYDFPNLSATSLKSVLEYLYTGNVTTANLTVSELIEIGDAGEQYDLKTLKEFSAAELWKRVVIEEPVLAFDIARFADLHDELKYLKHRALDVIAQNYDHLGVKADELVKRFGGTRGKELRNELMEYMGRRLRPIILP